MRVEIMVPDLAFRYTRAFSCDDISICIYGSGDVIWKCFSRERFYVLIEGDLQSRAVLLFGPLR